MAVRIQGCMTVNLGHPPACVVCNFIVRPRHQALMGQQLQCTLWHHPHCQSLASLYTDSVEVGCDFDCQCPMCTPPLLPPPRSTSTSSKRSLARQESMPSCKSCDFSDIICEAGELMCDDVFLDVFPDKEFLTSSRRESMPSCTSCDFSDTMCEAGELMCDDVFLDVFSEKGFLTSSRRESMPSCTTCDFSDIISDAGDLMSDGVFQDVMADKEFLASFSVGDWTAAATMAKSDNPSIS